jgi:hypothetical protein
MPNEGKPPLHGVGPPVSNTPPPLNEVIAQDHEKEKIERLRRAMYSRSLSPQMKDKPRRDLGESPSLVGEDFVRPEPQLAGFAVAPSTIGVARTIMSWFLVGSVTFGIGAVGFFAYYFFLGAGSAPVSPGNIDSEW